MQKKLRKNAVIRHLAIFLSLLTLVIQPSLAQEKPTPTTAQTNKITRAGFADIVEKLLPVVVNISATQTASQSGVDLSFLDDLSQNNSVFSELKERLKKDPHLLDKQSKKITSTGSGFLISEDGYIATNNHVIDGAKEILASLNNGKKFQARLVGIDEETDIALLKIETEEKLPFAKFGDSSKARIGDWVIVIGNPYGLGGSVSVGIVSANNRNVNRIPDFIQTDAAINKGNSGGPLFNIDGEVIGMASSLFSPSGGSVGIGFANPSLLVQDIIEQLRENGEVIRGWIGVSVQNVSEDYAKSFNLKEKSGAFVIEVIEDSPAHESGIIQGDLILEFDGKKIEDIKDLPKIISESKVGKKYRIVILRNGKVKAFKVRVEKMKRSSEFRSRKVS